MNETNPRSSGASAPDEVLAGVVEGATTPVPTRALLGRGIERIRVLSESRFRDLVRAMVEESIRRRLQSAPTPLPAAEPAPIPKVRPPTESAAARAGSAAARAGADPGHVAQARWSRLRDKHEGHLDSIEKRLSRLTGSFDAIRDSLERLEHSGTQRTTPSHDGPQTGGGSKARGRSKAALRRRLEAGTVRRA